MNKPDLTQEILENFMRCQRSADTDWQAFGLSQAQAGMLHLLHHHKSVSVKQTANFMGVSKSAATQLMEPLVAKGLVSRTSNPADRRVARLDLTAQGTYLIKQLTKHKLAGLRTAIASLDTTEIESLHAISQKMAAHIPKITK